MMERRHFILIAGIIKKLPVEVREPVARHFSELLAPTNGLFKKDLFLAACGVKE